MASGLQTPNEKQHHEVGRDEPAFPEGLESQPPQKTEEKTLEEATTPVPFRLRRKFGLFPPPPTQDPGPPPDGGTVAWLQVLAAHLMWFISWGLITSFGLFQSTYGEMLHAAPSTVSWIGTVQIFILLVLGTLSGRASDAGLVHEAVLGGTILIVVGLFMTSLCTQYYQIFLAQGVCTGIGMGILSMPGLSVPASYFKANKSLAVSIIASGAGTGGLVYPAMAQQLLPRVGFGWTIRIMAFVTLFISIIINLLVRVRIPARRAGPLFDFHALKEPAYVFFSIGFFLVYWSVYFAFYYVRIYLSRYLTLLLSFLHLTLITARSTSTPPPTPPSRLWIPLIYSSSSTPLASRAAYSRATSRRASSALSTRPSRPRPPLPWCCTAGRRCGTRRARSTASPSPTASWRVASSHSSPSR